jgi:hypothetical protein
MCIHSSEKVLRELRVTGVKMMEHWQMCIYSSEKVLRELRVTGVKMMEL